MPHSYPDLAPARFIRLLLPLLLAACGGSNPAQTPEQAATPAAAQTCAQANTHCAPQP